VGRRTIFRAFGSAPPMLGSASVDRIEIMEHLQLYNIQAFDATVIATTTVRVGYRKPDVPSILSPQ
jgi:hypothetical protein